MSGTRIYSTEPSEPESAPTPVSGAQGTVPALHKDVGGVAYDAASSSLKQGMQMSDSDLGDVWYDVDWQFLLPSSPAVDDGPSSASFWSMTGGDSETPASSFDSWLSLQRVMTTPKSQILRLPTFTMPSIVHRQHTGAGAQRVSQLILQTLKTYPLMMTRQKTPPPFLHPSLLASSFNDSLEPWHNCMSLVYMVNGRMNGSRRLFWRNYFELNRWELLATMHALAIYVIMRLDEPTGDFDGTVDGVLLRAVTVVAIQLMAVEVRSDPPPTLNSVWHDWILEESKRRLCVLFQIINMLVLFEPADMCTAHGDIILAPLPTQKQLWEAPDHYAWKRDCEMEPGDHLEFGLTKKGQLVKLGGGATIPDLGHSMAVSTDVFNWNEWCSGMDGIGNLVMLAGSLIQQV
ncbi:hypothetical protein V2A60_009991 [Cordyceps javanica]